MWDDLKSFLGFLVVATILLAAGVVWIIQALLPLLLGAGVIFVVLLGLGVCINHLNRVRAYDRLLSMYRKRLSDIARLQSQVRSVSQAALPAEVGALHARLGELLGQLWEIAEAHRRLLEHDLSELQASLHQKARRFAERPRSSSRKYESAAGRLRSAIAFAENDLEGCSLVLEALPAPKKVRYGNGRFDYPKPRQDWLEGAAEERDLLDRFAGCLRRKKAFMKARGDLSASSQWPVLQRAAAVQIEGAKC